MKRDDPRRDPLFAQANTYLRLAVRAEQAGHRELAAIYRGIANRKITALKVMRVRRDALRARVAP